MILQPINLYKYYQDFVDALRSTFFKLNLILDGEPAIYLSDLVWRACALLIWDEDHDGYIAEAQKSKRVNFSLLQNTSQIKILDLSKLITGGVFELGLLTEVKEIYWGKSTYTNNLPYMAFMNNTSIALLDIGPYVLGTERMVCYGATNLKKVVLNDVLIRIDGRAFRDCVSLEEISDIPDTCTGMYGDSNQESFMNCSSLKSITVGRGMQRIGDSSFRDCTAMETFYIKATTPPILGTDVFKNNPCKIYVPVGCGTAYKSATNWSAHASRIQEYNF